MPDTFRCRLVTPTKAILDDQVIYANVPAWDGLIGLQQRRAPIVFQLGLGELTLTYPDVPKGDAQQGGGGERIYFIDGGFAQMVNDELLILAENAIPAESLRESETAQELADAEAASVSQDADDKFEAAEAIRARQERARLKARIAKKSLAGGKGI